MVGATASSALAEWRAEGLSFRYPGAPRPAVDGVTLRIAPAETTAVLGPNGSGKSTLLRLLLGRLRPDRGRISFAGRPLERWRRRELARWIGVVPQEEEAPFPFTVREVVAMGRYPHLGPWRRLGPRDEEAIAAALRACDLEALADRPFPALSGGERQRARLARALAQEPRALVLDEPTASLDIGHAMGLFEVLTGWARCGATVLVVTHDLNMAARYARTLVLMSRGRIAAAGSPHEVLTPDVLEAVYGWPVRVLPLPGPGPDAGVPQVIPLRPRSS